MRATLGDLARQAGVSEATVSRVLNGKPGVSQGTRQAVLTALDVLGYERPARLRLHSVGRVGLIVPELNNPIFPAFAQVIESVLAQHSYTPLLCTQAQGGIDEDEYVETLLEQGVAGIVFVSGVHADTTGDHGRYRALIERGLPLVLVNGFAPDIPAAFISADDVEAAQIAVQHLVDLGHRRIGLAVGEQRYVPVQRKIQGFLAATTRLLALREEEARAWVQHSLFTLEGGHAAAAALLDRGATGIVCASDLMALGAVRAARRRRLTVPGDVSVVGYDDSPLIAFTDPPLTTLQQPVLAMGAAAVRALLDAIAGHPVPPTEYLFRPELVVRGSTAAAPGAGAAASAARARSHSGPRGG